MFDSEDLLVCARMVDFYQDKTNTIEWHNLWKYHVGVGSTLVCVALIRTDYFVYVLEQHNQIKIIKKLGSLFIVHRYLNNYDKQVLIENKQKIYVADYNKMHRAWNLIPKISHKFIEKYTIVAQAWNIKIICYKSTYLGFVRDQEEWLIYQVHKGKIEVVARIPFEENIRQFIEDRVDKESNLF